MADTVCDELQTRIAEVNELFTLPDVIVKINTMIRSSKTSATDIATAIAADMTLSAKVLKLVNSAFYGFSRRITSINYAIVILGFNAIRNLVMSVFMAGKCKNSVRNFNAVEFWRYSINCAVATDYIASLVNYPQRDDAFMAGLMNKIGIVVMNQYRPDELGDVIDKCQDEDILLLEAEKRLLGYDHYSLGAGLLDRWNLPEEITEVCRNISTPAQSASPLCWIAHVANILVRSLCLGSPGDNTAIPALAPGVLGKIGLKPEQLPEIMKNIVVLSEKSKDFLNL